MNEPEWWKPCVAEFLGTFALIFIGAGSVIVLTEVTNTMGGSQGVAMLVGVALAHGLAIATMITALGHLSGGHFNPAVTIAAMFTKRIRAELGVLYIVFQLLGAIFGSFMLLAALPADWAQHAHFGAPALSNIDPAKGVLLEAVMTFFLVLVVFGVGIDSRNPMRGMAGLGIGLVITMDILMGGSLTGAAMNPARAFGPTLFSRDWSVQYVYWLGPILGGVIAGLVYDSAYMPSKAEPQPTEVPKQPLETASDATSPP